MKDFSYFQDSFNLRKLSSYYMQVQLSNFGIGYTITDAIRNQYIATKSTSFKDKHESIYDNFLKAIKQDVYLNKHYKTVNFLYISKNNTLIPADYFDKKHLSEYYKFNFKMLPEYELHYNFIKDFNAYNIYSVPSNLVNYLVRQFPEVRLYHYTTALLNSAYKYVKNGENTHDFIKINFQNDLLNIIIIKNKKLVYNNSFQYTTDEEAVFFIMNVVKKLMINTKKAETVFQGTIQKDGQLHKYLSKYLFNYSFMSRYEKDYNFRELPPHILANLLDFANK